MKGHAGWGINSRGTGLGRRSWSTDYQVPLALQQLWWLVMTVTLRELGKGLLVTSGDYQDYVN